LVLNSSTATLWCFSSDHSIRFFSEPLQTYDGVSPCPISSVHWLEKTSCLVILNVVSFPLNFDSSRSQFSLFPFPFIPLWTLSLPLLMRCQIFPFSPLRDVRRALFPLFFHDFTFRVPKFSSRAGSDLSPPSGRSVSR